MSGLIVRIIKDFHGLVSSERCFQMHLRSTLRAMGFEPSLHDDNLWVLKDDDDSLIYISVYVDDLMISGKQPWVCLEKLKLVCNIKTDTNLARNLGILMQHNGTLAISTERYLKESLVKIEGKSGSLKREKTPM